jgi:WD40 repeat protein
MEKLLTEYSERLMSSSACSELIVSLERITFRALELRKSIVQHGKDLKETKKQIDEQNRLCQSVERVLDDVAAEMKEAIETDELEIWSKLVHDQPQLIDVEELKVRLKNRQELELKKLEFEVRELKKLKTTMDNLDHETKELNDYFSLEQGELIRKQTNRPFRCVAYTMVNILGDDVTGAATGGVEVFAAAESFNVHIFSYFTGEVLHIFSGGNHTNGNSVGHTGVITCLAINSMHVFSGSVDESIIAWNHNDMMRERTYLGHEGSIVALSLDDKTLASSSADLTIRLWNILDCQQLRVIYGHVKSVLALHLGSTLLLSGSADGEIRIWNINQIDRKCVTVECSKKLLGHEDSVTCVTCGDLEAVSGDSSGVIVVWWLETGQMLRKIQVHKGSIRSLQFDAVHIVSGGMDSNVCITDLAGGNVVQTLRGHESVVLAVAFDSIRIISTSVDNSLRFWRWGNKGSSEDKTHILGNDETLLQVSKKYDITLEQLVTWNGIFDPRRQVYPGLALIVKKGDTDSLTKAEKAKLDRDRRLNNTQSTNQAKLKGKLESNFSHVPSKYSELDDKAPTLGNRIYAKYKKDNGLFPIAFDSFAMKDDRSLAARIKLNGKFSKNNRKEDTFLDSKNPFILSVANVDIWGPISDELASTMLEVFVEKEIVQLIRKVKYDIHPLGSFSIGGRMSHLRALQLSKLSTQSTIPLDKIDEDDGINVKE